MRLYSARIKGEVLSGTELLLQLLFMKSKEFLLIIIVTPFFFFINNKVEDLDFTSSCAKLNVLQELAFYYVGVSKMVL